MKLHSPEFNVDVMCTLLKVSRSAYYAWLRKPVLSAKEQKDKVLSQELKHLFIEHQCRYGARRLAKSLRKLGYTISRQRMHSTNDYMSPVEYESALKAA
jgi:putative transposase